MSIFFDLLFGKSAAGALAGYSYDEYLDEWRQMFGEATAGTRHYQLDDDLWRPVIIQKLAPTDFEKQKRLTGSADPMTQLAAELSLLM